MARETPCKVVYIDDSDREFTEEVTLDLTGRESADERVYLAEAAVARELERKFHEQIDIRAWYDLPGERKFVRPEIRVVKITRTADGEILYRHVTIHDVFDGRASWEQFAEERRSGDSDTDSTAESRAGDPYEPASTEADPLGGGDKVSGNAATGNPSLNTPKKKRKRRELDKHAKECIRRYKSYERQGDRQYMSYVVQEYCLENPDVSHSGTYQRCSDNSDKWK